jgi:transcriptional repressor NrdR
MKCPYCGTFGQTSVVETQPLNTGEIRRRRKCDACGMRFNTFERSQVAALQVIKSGGYREDFDREKIIKGLRLACVKRPVSADALEQLVNRIEDQLHQLDKREVPSYVVGDLVIEGLKELDIIAYIRFALVYLDLDDLESIQSKITSLITESQSAR